MNASRPAELVLASTSPYRRVLLERLGLPFRCVAPPFDEASLPREGLGPRELAETLALRKAETVRDREPAAVVIGCDQLVSFEGRVFGKPGDAATARDQLEAMSGKTHELITAMAVFASGRVVAHTDVTRLTMRRLDRRAIERYVERDRPLDCAGSYKLEQGGVALFERIASEDHTAITGLPLLALTRILAELGFQTP
ncbi:Maf family protein [Paludisphaera mucosa]|uniref:7-methyl-GTP pyrophosphatase n=1 Tax=Paludisphaera mucosa TaxID=3030827 RepID=A0ABT6F7W9_9BACT|nr:nucleoside triphosphate pyrophosphatase [Paludisphaera mucosa]MDG3003676.1 Maf family protein [Paludisphaera mucosa]